MAAILGDPEALAAEVSRRAHHRAVEIAEEAGRRAAAILESAKQETESIRRQSAEAADRQVAALVRRNFARAELEAQRRFIVLREAPIHRVWQAAEEQLRALVQQEQWSKEAGVRFLRGQEPAPTWGGLLATSGRTRFDATFPTQFGLAQVTLRERVFQILSQETP